MEASNGWNSTYWTKEVAEKGVSSKSTTSPTTETRDTSGKLLDLDESDVSDTSDFKENGADARPHSNITTDFSFSFPVKKENTRLAAVNDANVSFKNNSKKETFNTEFIHCTLKDLLAGMSSPKIKAAVDRMESEGKEFSRKNKNVSNYASFDSFLTQQKASTRTMFKVNAKEFVPGAISFKSQNASNERMFNIEVKEFVPLSK